MLNEKYHGIFTALLTPFTPDDRINTQALRRLIRINLEKGVKGFYVCGSTGEAFLLTLEERKQVLETVVDEAGGKATIIAHIGCISTSQAIELALHAESQGVDAISSIPPFYFKFSFDEIKNYYFDIMDHVNTQMLVYNFPDTSGVTLNAANIGVFLNDKRVLGIKHTSSDFYSLERFRRIREDAVIFNGFDEMFLSGLAAGADGAIGSTYNFMAEKFILIHRLYKEGKMAEALQVQTKANNILQAVYKVGVIPAEKAILDIMGLEIGVCRKPFRTPSPDEYKMLEKVLAENE